MKKLFTNLKAAMTLLLLCGVCSAWAENYASVNTVLWGENFAHFGTKTPSAVGTGTGTTIYGGATISYTQGNTGTKGYNETNAGGSAPELLLKGGDTWNISGIKTGGAKKITLTFLSNKTSFSLTCSSTEYTVSGSGKSWSLTLGTGKTAPETFGLSLKNTASSTNARIDNVELKVTEAGQSADATSINASDVTIASDVTSGEIAYTISNPVEGKSLTAETSTEWISNVTVDATNSKVTFNTTANAGAQREGTITLKYDGASNKNVTITQAKPTTFASIEALVAAGAPASDGKETVTVTLTDEVIKSFYTSSGYRNGIYLNYTNTEGKDIEIYCKNVPEAWVAGGTVSGTLENCIWKNYNGIWELCPDDWDDLSYEAPATYAISIDEAIANGTVEASETEAAPGVEVSLTVTPADHYVLASLSVKDEADNAIEVTDNKFTMPASDVTVSATFAEKAKYTVTYYSLGETAGTEDVYDGELIAAAPTPTLTGWELIGWTANDAYETSTTAPTAFELSTPITENLTLYAVFKKVYGEVPSDFDLTVTSGDFTISYGDKYASTDISSVSSGKISSSVSTNARQYTFTKISDRVYSIYDKVKEQYITYKSSTDLAYSSESYNWTISASAENGCWRLASGTSGRAFVYRDSDPAIFGGYSTTNISSTSGSGEYHDVMIKAISSAITTYTTSGQFDVSITDAGWATACLPFNATVSANATAYYVTGTNDDALVKEAANVIPAGTGVLLKSNDGGAAPVTFTASAEEADPATGNMMVGSLVDYTFGPKDNYTYYILTVDDDNKVGFYWDWETENEGASAKCPAGKAVLAVPANAGSAKAFFNLDDEATGINSVEMNKMNNGIRYNLNGQAVGNDFKGVVIVNGKKFVK